MRILLLQGHSIEEYDQVRLLAELGYDVFSLGSYIDPRHPHDPKRPALPEAPFHPELKQLVEALPGERRTEQARCRLPEALLAWAQVISVHAFERAWIGGQWPRLRAFVQSGGRVIWRTIGQCATANEVAMAEPRAQGLEIVRYSPKERHIPGFAGEDTLIRFYKDPEEWYGWTGEEPLVINLSADLVRRGDFTNWNFWEATTAGLPRLALGPGSEMIGGPGVLSLAELQGWLRRARVFVYTGTQPASYTLGFIEAMMTGIPIVSIGPSWHKVLPYGPDLFEAHELVEYHADDPELARRYVKALLDDQALATAVSKRQREAAIKLFGKSPIVGQWKGYLG